MKKETGEISIKDILSIFIPKLWLIVIVAVVCAVAMGVRTEMTTDTYTATTKYAMGKVPMDSSDSKNTGINAAEIEAMRSMVDNYQEILNSQYFSELVRDELVGFDNITAKNISSMFTVSVVGETTCFVISTKTTNPELSKAVADVVHREFPDVVSKMFAYAIEITKLDSADLPEQPDAKSTIRDAVIGFAVGAVISALIIFILAKFDVVIRTKEKLEENFDIPILGAIPRLDPDE